MPYVTYNNGLSFTWHDPSENYQLTGDEQIIGDGLTPPDLTAIQKAFPSYVAPVPAAPDPPVTQSQLTAALTAAGVQPAQVSAAIAAVKGTPA